jgi:hypothetical protein
LANIDLDSRTGIWRRESLTIEQGDSFEDSAVYWLQDGDFFADMRWPLKPGETNLSTVSAFAGRTHWTPPKIEFHHHIDIDPQDSKDEGVLTIVNGKLWEHGEATLEGRSIKFKEQWMPLHATNQSRSTKTTVVDTADEIGYLVQVDNYAIGMNKTRGAFSAACLKRSTTKESWHLLQLIGDIRQLHPLIKAHRIRLMQEKDL